MAGHTSRQVLDEESAHLRLCPFCGRIFRRSGGARRHAKACPDREGRPLPPPAKRGRKQRACNECSRVKVRCDGGRPCKRCSVRSRACTFTGGSHTQETPARGRSELPFLLACTDPQTNLVKDVLTAGEPESDAAKSAAWNRSESDIETINPQLLFLGFYDPDLDSSLDFDSLLNLPDTADDVLGSKLHHLKSEIQLLYSIQGSVQNAELLQAFDDFFICDNFRELIIVFFRRRQLLARMIHWPTFDPTKADSSLLLAIALCGMAYSAQTAEPWHFLSFAPTLQSCADKYIFKRLKQCHAGPTSQPALEMSQAAYLITILQISTNDNSTRRRAITKRQPALVVALRRLKIIGGTPSSFAKETDWHAFVQSESCVRLAAFTFFNDGLLALFCNTPPNTTVADMSSPMPSSDGLWDADGPESFAVEQSKSATAPRTPISMKQVLTGLLDDDWNDTSPSFHQGLNVFDLYATIGAFQLILFNHRANLLPTTLDHMLLRALDRWETLWHSAIQRVPPAQHPWLGVAKYAPEFALVSRKIIDAAKSTTATAAGSAGQNTSTSTGTGTGTSEYLQCTPQYHLRAFHEFLLQHG